MKYSRWIGYSTKVIKEMYRVFKMCRQFSEGNQEMYRVFQDGQGIQ